MNKQIIILLATFIILINYIYLCESYKLERLNEENEKWETIEENIDREQNEDDSDDSKYYYKTIKVERREHLYMRIQRDNYDNTSSTLEPLSVKFEIRSQDIQETFILYGLNNDTTIKTIEPKENKQLTTPIKIESCFDQYKPIYFSLNMFNYLWGGDLQFNVESNDLDNCEIKSN